MRKGSPLEPRPIAGADQTRSMTPWQPPGSGRSGSIAFTRVTQTAPSDGGDGMITDSSAPHESHRSSYVGTFVSPAQDLFDQRLRSIDYLRPGIVRELR